MKTVRSLLFALACMSVATFTLAQPSAVPPNIVAANNLPMVMLSASKDFTMFWKAYTDFDDIDFDGAVDMTFKPDFVYYGYFDWKKCYGYEGDQFVPKRVLAAEPTTIPDTTFTGYYCNANAGEWSGNFLNWLSMSRIDVLRKVLYGGKRHDDGESSTTLELSFVPRNSQAFVKYYNRADLPYLAPFATGGEAVTKGVTFCRRPNENEGKSHEGASTPVIRTAVGNVILWNMTEVRTCNWSGEINYSWKPGTITHLASTFETPAGTLATGVHEHATSVPTAGGDNKSYIARVQVCVDKLFGSERCRPYPDADEPTVHKPAGLLQEFGESLNNGVEPARAEFALMLGSYDHNLNAGVLRKNMGQINDEINAATGQFSGDGVVDGIIKSLDALTLYDYNIATGNYDVASCSATARFSDALGDTQCPSWGNPVGELLLEAVRYYAGNVNTATYKADNVPRDTDLGLAIPPAWTDPLKNDPKIGPSETLRSQLYGKPICRPLSMLSITSGSNSFDDELADKDLSDINSAAGAEALTNTVGAHEGGINGSTRLIGESGTDNDKLCTGKTVAGLGEVKGICADGPNFRGTYLGAGIAYHANTNPIRPDSDFTAIPADAPTNKLRVRNYGVSMSGGVATIQVPTHDGKTVYITPAGLDYLNGGTTARPHLPGNMVDFKILSRSSDGKSGSALVLWQHSMLGEDQDQDMLGALRWEVDDSATPWTLKVYTRAIESDTGSTKAYSFGYTLVGTTNADNTTSDGVHFHSGINYAPSTEANGTVQLSPGATQGTSPTDSSVCGAKLCSVVDGKTTRGETYKTYKMVGNTDALLKEPLWFISKYGGFKYYPNDPKKPQYHDDRPTDENREPWDVKRADGLDCGGDTGRSCSDDEPDNYFVARRPDLLEKSLNEILEDIVNSSNTSPAIASSQLRASDLKYVASFDPSDGRGELAAYAIDSETGLFLTDPAWKAHEKLTDASAISRPVITNNGTTGVPFQWDDLNTDKQNVLKSGEDDEDEAEEFAEDMMAWLRGDTENKSDFRIRATSSVLGPVVNSNPTVQSPPNGNYFGDAFSGYSTFVQTWKSRRSILWVGAGDGMLHGFDASSSKTRGGTPVMSYIPEPLFSRLPEWASPSKPKVQAFVDGSPFVGDVKTSDGWATYLFSSLGRGGKAIFALDVTKAGTVSSDVVTGSELDEGHASSIFKWQFTSADDADLGYVVSEPTTSRFTNQAGQIARMNNNKFAVLFGNGVMSETGNAVLYILFVDGPSAGSWTGRYVKIVAQAKADDGPENGLSQPVWVDENNDSIADVIYAGDIQGNLWKFDVSSADESDWALAYSTHPLFIATDEDDATKRLPITGAPEYRFHPMGGMLVSIATGKSIASGDFPSSGRTDAMFGIWDKPLYAETAPSDLEATLPRGYDKLTAREFVSIDDQTSLLVTGAAMNWDEAQGWNLPFKETSEMSVSNMAVANGQLIAVTVRPQPETDLCYAEPLARLIAVDAMTGLPASGLLGTITIDGVEYSIGAIDIDDQKVRISNDSVGTGSNHDNESCGKGEQNCIRIVGEETDKGLSSANNRARIYWREIPGLKTLEVE